MARFHASLKNKLGPPAMLTTAIVSIVLALNCERAWSVKLPSREGLATRAWSIKIGSKVYKPAISLLETTAEKDESNYYYAYGHDAGMSDQLKSHRVDHDGLAHLFYLPGGIHNVSMKIGQGRRSSLSELTQLQSGQNILPEFPFFEPKFRTPDTSVLHQTEKRAETAVLDDQFQHYLRRIVNSGDGHDPTRSWTNANATKHILSLIQGEFRNMGLKACLQRSHGSGDVTNVIGYVPSNEKNAGSMTVGAHYDSRPFDGPAPGANDNGSGLAVLLATARAYTAAKAHPRQSLYFVAFGAEEAGLLGSDAFVQGLFEGTLPKGCQPPESSVIDDSSSVSPQKHAAIILDEVAWNEASRNTIKLETKDSDDNQRLMESLFQANSVDNVDDPMKVRHSNNPFGSDHMSWLNRGQAAVLVINDHDEAYPAYHSAGDGISNVDMSYGTRVARMVLGGLLRATALA